LHLGVALFWTTKSRGSVAMASRMLESDSISFILYREGV